MGLLSLDDLVYFAKYHPDESSYALSISRHPISWYKFSFGWWSPLILVRYSYAIVGINITAYALQLVRTRQLQLFFYTHGTTKEMYHEFYCTWSPLSNSVWSCLLAYLMFEFAKHWSSHTTPLTVMDFQRVFLEFQEKVLGVLIENKVPLLPKKAKTALIA